MKRRKWGKRFKGKKKKKKKRNQQREVLKSIGGKKKGHVKDKGKG